MSFYSKNGNLAWLKQWARHHALMFLLMDQMENMLKNQINKKYAPYFPPTNPKPKEPLQTTGTSCRTASPPKPTEPIPTMLSSIYLKEVCCKKVLCSGNEINFYAPLWPQLFLRLMSRSLTPWIHETVLSNPTHQGVYWQVSGRNCSGEKQKLNKTHIHSYLMYVCECSEQTNDEMLQCNSLDSRYCCKEFRTFIK